MDFTYQPSTPEKPTFTLINTQDALHDFLTQAHAWFTHESSCFIPLADDDALCDDVLFIDTEFFKRNTYYPKLGLVQFAVIFKGDVCAYLLDAHLDLTAFWRWAVDAKLWVMHAASEDIDIIFQQVSAIDSALSAPPTLPDVFDTQIGLSFLDFGLQLSYQDALSRCLDVHIDKQESLSDWLARPLSDKQLAYAAEDVIYLPALYAYVCRALQQKGWYDYVCADCQSFKYDVCQTTPDDTLYKNWVDFRYTQKQLAQLQALCAWREQQARLQDIPRTFVLKKPFLRELINSQPKTRKQLAELKGAHPKLVRQYGERILQLLHELPDEAKFPKKGARPFRESKQSALVSQLKALVVQEAQRMGLPQDVLMRKRWLTALLEYVAYHKTQQGLPSYLTGWRMTIITQPILEELAVHQALLFEHIVPHEQKQAVLNQAGHIAVG